MKCTYSLISLIYQLIDEHIHMVLLFKTKTTNRPKFLLSGPPSFLAPGTRLMADKFSKDQG